jgi:hypothetical protein
MRQVSKTNHIHTSTGETLTRTEFNRRVRQAKEKKVGQQKDEFGYNFCQDCSENNRFGLDDAFHSDEEYTILDCSHKISVKECIESCRAELAYDLDNIIIRCRHHHRIFDKSNLKFKAK